MVFLFLVAIVLVPAAAAAQGNPLGPEFRVNTFTPLDQNFPSVAADGSNGNFVVVWNSVPQDGDNMGVFGQRYLSSGTPSGGEFRVNTYTTRNQRGASVAADFAGNFVVVWMSYGQDGSSNGVFGQRFSASGTPLGGEFRVNTFTVGDQNSAAAASGAGGFIVVWAGGGDQDGSGFGIFGQRYDTTGVPLDPEFRVNTYTTGSQTSPAVAAAPSGEFVVVWRSAYGQDGSAEGISGQRYSSAGVPVGSEFQVNTYTTGYQFAPSVSASGAGFVVVWNSFGQDGSSTGVFAQRYAASGTPLGSEFRVNSYTTGVQAAYSAVASDLGEDFVVVWHDESLDGFGFGVFGQRYLASGVPLGTQFLVNSYTTGFQRRPKVAAPASPGTFVVVWMSENQDGSGYGVFGQRYSMIVPVELMRFVIE